MSSRPLLARRSLRVAMTWLAIAWIAAVAFVPALAPLAWAQESGEAPESAQPSTGGTYTLKADEALDISGVPLENQQLRRPPASKGTRALAKTILFIMGIIALSTTVWIVVWIIDKGEIVYAIACVVIFPLKYLWVLKYDGYGKVQLWSLAIAELLLAAFYGAMRLQYTF